MRAEPKKVAIICKNDKLVVTALGCAEIITYGTLYYCVAVIAGHVGRDFALSEASIFAFFSFALFASALMSFPAGYLMNRYGVGTPMIIASVAAALSLGIAAISWNAVVFMLALFGMQMASAFLFYEAAFVLLVQRDALRAKRQIILLTLIVGFSSTLFWPLTSLLLNLISWREILAIYAGCNVLVALPLIMFSLGHRSLNADNENNIDDSQADSQCSPRVIDLALITIGFSLTTFVFSAFLGQMIPILSSVGLGQEGPMISALFGPSQVLIRLFATSLSERMAATHLTILSSILLSVATVIVALASHSIVGASVFTVLLGFSSGLSSICRGALPLSMGLWKSSWPDQWLSIVHGVVCSVLLQFHPNTLWHHRCLGLACGLRICKRTCIRTPNDPTNTNRSTRHKKSTNLRVISRRREPPFQRDWVASSRIKGYRTPQQD